MFVGTRPRPQKLLQESLSPTTRFALCTIHALSREASYILQPTTDKAKHLLKQAIHDETVEKTRAIAFKHDGTDVPAKH
jgi:hypothetical protein